MIRRLLVSTAVGQRPGGAAEADGEHRQELWKPVGEPFRSLADEAATWRARFTAAATSSMLSRLDHQTRLPVDHAIPDPGGVLEAGVAW